MPGDFKKRRELGIKLENDVRKWLESAGASFRTDKEFVKGEYIFTRVDFYVLAPFPLAIQIVLLDELDLRAFNPTKLYRLMADRIVFAENAGNSIPVIGISNSTDAVNVLSAMPAFDAVFNVNELPQINELPKLLKLNHEMQHLLSKGNPKTFSISDQNEIDRRWQDSLSLFSILEADLFPAGTLASQIKTYLSTEFLQWQNRLQNKNTLPNSVHFRSYKTPNDVLNARLEKQYSLFLATGLVRTKLQNIIDHYVFDKAGGKSKQLPIFLGKDNQRLLRKVSAWNSRSNNTIILRILLTSSETTARHRASEFYAESWLIRAQQPNDAELILLLPSEHIEKAHTIRGERNKTYQQAYIVNVFEAAGWKVFPWDFQHDEPAFLKYINYELT